MISVAFVSPAHGRFAVTALVLAQRRRLICELAARGIDAVSIIVACDENLEIAAEYGCETIEAPNAPLGAKANIGLQQAARLADTVVWVGSDDWIHPDVFDPLIDRLGDVPVALISGTRFSMVDVATGTLQRVAWPSQYGSIPWLIDSRLLRTRRAQPIRPDLKRGLDGALVRGLRRTGIPFAWEIHDPHEFRCVDFKTDQNLSPYEGVAASRGTGEPEPAWAALAGWFPADLVTRARELSERTQP